jgi:hypothetical protein
MRENIKKIIIGMMVIGLVSMVSGIAIAANEVTITGTITENGQLAEHKTDGEIYKIGDTEKGNEVMELIGKKVTVTGIVVKEGGGKKIKVTSYFIEP